ncbi:FHA domain-containing protein FhaB/FipA [Actinomyces vulturis]|uniref:FHA domain-containing protein FhaB/FipA n=1 Tax=Actinomyces vulturis TaxID=1857645 RepID=UPI00082A34F5|nr:FHA domain-containing protein [Actinomyces vulturis]
MSELAFTILRLGYLLLLWVFLALTMHVLRKDIFGTPSRSRNRRSMRNVLPAPFGASAPTPVSHPAPAVAPVRRKGATRLVITEGPLAGSTVPLTPSSIVIGRSPSCTLVLDDDYASGRHARVFPQDGTWWVEDLGSTNGTMLGDSLITDTVELPIGVPLRIGQTRLELRP